MAPKGGTGAQVELFGNTLSLADSATLHWLLWGWVIAITGYFVLLAVPDFAGARRRNRIAKRRMVEDNIQAMKRALESMKALKQSVAGLPQKQIQEMMERALESLRDPLGTAQRGPLESRLAELEKELQTTSKPTRLERAGEFVDQAVDYVAVFAPIAYALVGAVWALPGLP